MSSSQSMPSAVGGLQAQPKPAIAYDDAAEKTGSSGYATPRADDTQAAQTDKKDGKKKRSLFGFGKKKDGATASQAQPDSVKTATSAAGAISSRPAVPQHDSSKLSSATGSVTSPNHLNEQAFIPPSSPGRGLSSSPRLASPAGSQIFERDVDAMPALQPQSPAIPSHIQTENHIPPVLDASSEAITDNRLDPDSVEIVTHAHHQPASASVKAGPGGSGPGSTQLSYEQLASSWAEDLGPLSGGPGGPGGDQDDISNYGSMDNADIRRLSFISFADVVQAEHSGPGVGGGSRESMQLAGLTSLSANRSPSPIRSPVSSQSGPGTSPPTSNPGSIKGVEMSPGRKSAMGSPVSATAHSVHPLGNVSGEVNIETMSQALRRTGSKEFSALRSYPTSPVEGPSR